MALRAKIISLANIDEITKLNDGVRPHEQTLDGDTFYIYDDEEEIQHEIIGREEFNRRFRLTVSGRWDNTIVEK